MPWQSRTKKKRKKLPPFLAKKFGRDSRKRNRDDDGPRDSLVNIYPLVADVWSEEARAASIEARRNGNPTAENISVVEGDPKSKHGFSKEALLKNAAEMYGRNSAQYKAFEAKLAKQKDSAPSTSLRMYDKVEIDDAAKVRVLDNGYLAAMPRIARTGIQVYHGDECGRGDMERVRVFRPEADVFHKDAVHSYTHLPVTLDHPMVAVDASNWKQYAVGETGDEVLRDGGAVRVPMMLRDAEAIKAFKNGTNQLSVGYDCDLEWVDGVTDDGEHYDAIQHGIRANHLAVVAAARGGSTLKIGDAIDEGLKGDFTMNFKTILVDGMEVQVADSAAVLIQRTITSLEGKLHDMRDKFKKKEEDEEEADKENEKKEALFKSKDEAIKAKDETIKGKDKELETKNGEIAVLKGQLADAQKKFSPEAIDAAARERFGVINKAQSIMSGKLKTDGMTVSEIRRAVVDARVNNTKDWSDDRVEGAFDAMQTNVFSDRNFKQPTNTLEDAVHVFGRPGSGYQSPAELRDKAYGEYDQSVTEAWRGRGTTQ